MAINEKALTKGDLRSLEALRKKYGNELADPMFEKYLDKKKTEPVEKINPDAQKMIEILQPYVDKGELTLGNPTGYTINKGRNKKSPTYNMVTVKVNERKPVAKTKK